MHIDIRNKPLQAAGISEDNAQSLMIVQKMKAEIQASRKEVYLF